MIKLIMEYLPAGSLKDYLPRHKAQTSQERLLLYAIQICQVLNSSSSSSSSEDRCSNCPPSCLCVL